MLPIDGCQVSNLTICVSASLIYDLPYSITLPKQNDWIIRKGACPAEQGQPVIIPGSMGSLLIGLGNKRWLSSASHRAGRPKSRGSAIL